MGGLFTWLPFCWSDNKNREKLKFTLKALNEEANELLKIMQDLFDDIKKIESGGVYTRFLKSPRNYFSTYENNSYVVGEISDEEYRNCIIKHYLLSKRLVDALLDNSLFFEKYLENQAEYAANKKPYFKDMSDIFEERLCKEAIHLQFLVDEIEQNISFYNASHKKFIENFKP